MSHPLTTLQPLIEKLQKFNDLPEMERFKGRYVCSNPDRIEDYPVGAPALIQQIKSLAADLLITAQGRPHADRIEILKRQGFPVTAGERDSFGWLSGVIHTTNGKIVFG